MAVESRVKVKLVVDWSSMINAFREAADQLEKFQEAFNASQEPDEEPHRDGSPDAWADATDR